MPNKTISCEYGLIGNELDLKKDIELIINEEGTIEEITFKELEDGEIISNERNVSLMVPGFINSHVHIGDAFAKELGFNKDLAEVVAPPYGLKHKLHRQTADDIKIKGIQKAASEMISNGTTFFVDFREEGVEGVKLLKTALNQSPIKYLAFGRYMDESEIESIFDLADGVGLSSYDKVTPHNKRFVVASKEGTNKLMACHVAEKNRDSNILNKIIEDNLVEVIIHGTKFIRPDLEKIKENNISLVLCPRCNGYFGMGFPPMPDILKLGIPISLGTDNLMLNNTNLFEEMRYLYRISRVLCAYNKDIQILSRELLKMVTINAAKIFNLENDIGSISEGKNADFFKIDLSEPNFYVNQLKKDILYPLIVQRTTPENIKNIYINGKLVLERI